MCPRGFAGETTKSIALLWCLEYLVPVLALATPYLGDLVPDRLPLLDRLDLGIGNLAMRRIPTPAVVFFWGSGLVGEDIALEALGVIF